MPLKTLVLASHNQGKLREFQELLEGLAEEVKSAAEYNLPEPEETGSTFEENAALKAELAAQATNLPCLSDDSGLSVHALGGDPGIYSARWAGPDKDFGMAMEKVHALLKSHEDKSAQFVAVLALAVPGEETKVFKGTVDGNIVWPPRGDKGFGYDPMFVPEGHEQTFGEMDPALKQTMSHRVRAVEKLRDYLSDA